jgi:hypothetical protein
MTRRFLYLACFLALAHNSGFSQSSYKGLTPGKSLRADAERMLGQPVNKVSETLIEYRPQPLTSKVYIQYRKDSPVVERVEVLCRMENSTCDDLIKSLNLHLPQEPNSAKADNQKWKFLYGSPLFVVTSGDFANGVVPARVAFYSRELYEAEFVRVGEANETAIAKAEEDRKKPDALEGSYGEVTGIVKLRSADGSLRPVGGALVEFYRTDGLSGYFKTTATKYGTFHFLGLSQTGTWVIVASGPGLKWSYLNRVRTPVGGLEIIAEPGDGARPTQEQVMAAIR